MTDWCGRYVREDLKAEEQARQPVSVTRVPPGYAANIKSRCDKLVDRKVKIRREGVSGQSTEDWKPVKNGVKDGKVTMVIKGENWNRLGTSMPLLDCATAWWRLRIRSNDGSIQLDIAVSAAVTVLRVLSGLCQTGCRSVRATFTSLSVPEA